MRVPQGSILSVTLFSIKINSLAKVVNDNIDGSLYVDDFLICYRANNMNNIEHSMLLFGKGVSNKSFKTNKMI
jgi:hypothetical protein